MDCIYHVLLSLVGFVCDVLRSVMVKAFAEVISNRLRQV